VSPRPIDNTSNNHANAACRWGRHAETGKQCTPENIGPDSTVKWCNMFFTVQESRLGGLGAFASKDLREGDIILIERPLLRLTWGLTATEAFDELDTDDQILVAQLARSPAGHYAEVDGLLRSVIRANAYVLFHPCRPLTSNTVYIGDETTSRTDTQD
jgi:hypothetical protein